MRTVIEKVPGNHATITRTNLNAFLNLNVMTIRKGQIDLPYKKKPRWLKWLDRYESLVVVAILGLMAVEVAIEILVLAK